MKKPSSYDSDRNKTVARVCYEANRAYCKIIGEFAQSEWDSAAQWQKDSVTKGVAFHFSNPDAGPEASHISWLNEKRDTGWTYGRVKDAGRKEHPCMVDYNELPLEQRVKDYIFGGIVDAFRQVEDTEDEGKVYEKLLVVEDEFRKNEIIKNVLFTNCDILPLGHETDKQYKSVIVMLSRGSDVEKDMLNYYVSQLKARLLPGGKITVL